MIENMFSTFTNMLSSITKEFNIFAICIIAVLFIYYICPKIFKIFNKIFKKRKDKESALFSYIFQDKLKKQEGKESAYAIGWWICIFGFGFGLYFLSFMQAPRAEAQELWSHILSAVITSIRASIKMFSFDFDYADVRRIADNSISYLVVISICFLSASLWTIFVVMNLFFKGIMNEIKLTFIAKNIFQLFRSIKMTFIAKYIFRLFRWKNNNYHYIIVGCEKSMRTFLDDLQKEKISKFDITIITGIPIEKGDTSTYSKEFIKEGYTVINGKVDEAALERAGINNVKYRTRVIAITECDKQNLNVAGIITQKIFTNIFSEELKELKNKYKKNEDKRKQEEIKFLDEMVKSLSISTKSDEEYNKLSSEKKTEYDETQKNKQKIIDSLKNINLEAHIMYSFIERTEHFAFAENAYGKVDFFNPYELRARRFFGEHPITSLIPHSFIDTNKARLKEKYNVKHIFVGFGNANYQMLKGSIQTCQLLNCDYNATIYDENINNAPVPSVNQAMFMNHSSGLFDGDQTSSETEYFRSPEEKYDINFKNGNVLTKNFYTGAENCLIKEMENDFTIIYVALGDDKLNIETACEIRQCLY
ncbi:MAG: hypothetical protein FWC26_07655, partial [Fibromonadales bacterium]|nr:hypothetical protein [Fibromonadales bacterium]